MRLGLLLVNNARSQEELDTQGNEPGQAGIHWSLYSLSLNVTFRESRLHFYLSKLMQMSLLVISNSEVDTGEIRSILVKYNLKNKAPIADIYFTLELFKIHGVPKFL